MVPELAWIRLGIQDRDLGQLGRRLSNGASGQSPWQVRRYHAMGLRLSAQPQRCCVISRWCWYSIALRTGRHLAGEQAKQY